MRRFKKAFIWFCLIFILLILMLTFLQEKLIFLPTELQQDYAYEFSETHEEFYITAEDGAILNAIHFKRENPKGVILYFHGNAGNLARWGEITSFLAKKEYDVIVMDYRTYGKSTGELGEQLLYNDAQLFYDYASEKYDSNSILIYGRSLGSTFATFVASRNNVKKLVLETPFYSLLDVAKNRFPFLPMKKMLNYKFPTYNYIQQVKCPITIYHGTEDRVVPYWSGEKLFKSITKNNKEFITIDMGRHNDLINYTEYLSTIDKALE